MRSTRFAVRGLAVFAALTLALAACEENVVPPAEEITVSVLPQNPSIDVGETITLTAVVNGTDNKGVTWASQNSNIASVNASTGEVTGNQAGQAVITATSSADPDVVGATTVTVNPPPAIEVTIFPTDAGSRQVRVGQTLQLSAQVSNTTNQAVSWSSQTPNLATVDANTGVVTGVAAGTAIIQATPAADPSRAATTSVTVLPEVPVNVVIQSITDNDGTHVDRDDISGQINVTIEFDAPAGSNVSMLEVLLDDDVVCSQNIGSGEADLGDDAQAQATFVCSIPTDSYDATTGAPDFANGEHDLSARITTPGGSVRAEAGETVTFNNDDGWVINVQPANGPVADDGGLSWYGGGDVKVTGLPVLYSGETINTVSFEFFGINKAGAADGAGFSATYSAAAPSGEIVNFIDDGAISAEAQVASAVYTGGQQATTDVREWQVNGTEVASTFVFRLDNESPDPGDFFLTTASGAGSAPDPLCCSNNWVGAAYEFASGKENESDGGVGVDAFVIYWGEAGDDADDIIAAGQVVETGAELAETQTNTALTAVAVVTDRLGNSDFVELDDGTFGVDHDGPTLGGPTGPDDGEINPADASWDFDTRSDTLSGFNLPIAGIGRVIANFTEDDIGACVHGDFDATANLCGPIVGNESVPVPASEAYFTMSFMMRDQAGNTTAATDRTILVDVSDPTVSGPPVFPASLTGGASATFGIASVEDNVDLEAFDLGVDFDGLRLPMGPFQTVGDGFGGDLVDEAEDVEYTIANFVRAVEATDGSGAPLGGLDAAEAIFFRGRDVAGNTGTSANFAFAGGTVPAGENAASYSPDLDTFTLESSEAVICDASDPGSDGDCETNDESTTLTAVVSGPSGSFTNPYARVWFYFLNLNTGEIEFIGEDTSASQDDDGNVRTFTYSTTLSATGLGTQANMQIVALAVTSDGDALLSPVITIDVDVD